MIDNFDDSDGGSGSGKSLVPYAAKSRFSLLNNVFTRAASDFVRGYGLHVSKRTAPTLSMTFGLAALVTLSAKVFPYWKEVVVDPHVETYVKIMICSIMSGPFLAASVQINRYRQTGHFMRHNSFKSSEGRRGTNSYEYPLVPHGEEGVIQQSALGTFGEAYQHKPEDIIRVLKIDLEKKVRDYLKPYRKNKLHRVLAAHQYIEIIDTHLRENMSDILKPESIDGVVAHLRRKFIPKGSEHFLMLPQNQGPSRTL